MKFTCGKKKIQRREGPKNAKTYVNSKWTILFFSVGMCLFSRFCKKAKKKCVARARVYVFRFVFCFIYI